MYSRDSTRECAQETNTGPRDFSIATCNSSCSFPRCRLALSLSIPQTTCMLWPYGRRSYAVSTLIPSDSLVTRAIRIGQQYSGHGTALRNVVKTALVTASRFLLLHLGSLPDRIPSLVNLLICSTHVALSPWTMSSLLITTQPLDRDISPRNMAVNIAKAREDKGELNRMATTVG